MSARGGRRPYEVRRKPKGQFSTIKASKPLILQQHQQKKRKKILGSFLGRFSLSLLSNFSPKHILSTTKRLCFFSFHHNYKVVFLYPIFLSLVLYLVFEVQGCECRFLATIHTLFFLQFYLAFSCSIICFIAFPSMFLLLSMSFQHVSLLIP